MAQRIIACLVNTFWGVIATSVILVGLFLSLGRYYVPLIDNVRADFEQKLSQVLSAQVSSEALTGDWQGFNPVVGVQRLTIRGSDEPANTSKILVSASEAQLEIDMFRSLLALSPVYREAIVSGLQIHFYKTLSGGWSSPLFQSGGKGADFGALYSAAHDLKLVNTQLIFHEADQVNVVNLVNFSLDRGAKLTQSKLSIIDSVNPQPIDVVVETQGIVGDKNFKLAGYLEASDVDLSPYRFLSKQLLHSEQASLRLWAKWQVGEAFQIHGDVAATTFFEDALADKAEVKANIGLRYKEQNLAVFSQAVALEFKGKNLVLPDLRLDYKPNTLESKFSISQVDLGLVQQFYSLFPKKLKSTVAALEALKPRGDLRNIALKLYREGEQWQAMFAADAIEVSIDAWRGAPGFELISGRLLHQGRFGWFEANDDETSLNFERYFDQQLAFTQLKGSVGWHFGEQITIATNDLKARLGEAELDLKFNIDLVTPQSVGQFTPTITMALGIKNLDANDAPELIPNVPGVLEVKQWLRNSELKGELSDSSFFINTSTSKKTQWFPAVQFIARGKTLGITVDPQWPRVEMLAPSVVMSHRNVKTFSQSGMLLDIALSPVSASAVVKRGGTDIDINAEALGPLESSLYLFQNTPLAELVNRGADGWLGDGDFSSQVNLKFSLDNIQAIKAKVLTSIMDASLILPEADLSFKHVQGQINYDEGVLTSEGLSSEVFGKPWQLKLRTDKEKDQYVLAGQGKFNVIDVANWLEQPLLLFAIGSSSAESELRVGAGIDPRLTIKTDLKGVDINLPEPFNKDKLSPLALSVNVGLGENIAVSLASELAQFNAIVGDQIRGVAVIGSDESLLTMPERGFLIGGGLVKLSAASAVDVYNNYLDFEQRYDGSDSSAPFVVKDFRIDSLLLGDEFIPNVNVDALNVKETWSANIASTLLNAKFEWEAEDPIQVEVNHFHYPFVALDPADIATQTTPWRPSDLLALKVNIKELVWNNENYGSWQFDVEPEANTVLFNNITGRFKAINVSAVGDETPASLLWIENSDGSHNSNIQAMLSSDDVKEVFDTFDLQPMLSSKSASAAVNVRWSNTPFDVDYLQLSGGLDFDLRDGQFLRTEGAPTGLLKLLGVFNFDNLARRMRLDFGDLVNDGLSFDQFAGSLALVPGQVTLDEPLFVEGPSSDFRMTGALDLNAETIDGELIAVVPVSRNLPWLAALAGGLPAAAGVYLVSKVFSDGFDRLSSASYSIDGPWDDPEIRFLRLFDDKNNLPKTEAMSETTPNTESVE